MTIQSFTAPLVGDFYRPPAKGLLQCLPSSHSLLLRREPENPYDENAVMVLLSTSTLTDDMMDTLEEKCAPFGFGADEIFAAEEWHLGYIAKEYAVHLTKLLINDDGEEVPYTATLSFFTNERGQNKPLVNIEIDIPEET